MISNIIDILRHNYPLFLTGVKNTLILSLIGTIAGLGIGFILSLFRDIPINQNDSLVIKIFKRLLILFTNFYIEFVRGTPMMVQAVFLYYTLYKTLKWSPMSASLIIVSLNTASYMAEILRSGIQSVDKGQKEAAIALGMTNYDTFIRIILPQALRNSFPAIGNEFVVNIKDTSVLNAIQLTELYFQAISYAGRTYQFSESMAILLIIYFLLTFTTTRILNYIEKRMNHPKGALIV